MGVSAIQPKSDSSQPNYRMFVFRPERFYNKVSKCSEKLYCSIRTTDQAKYIGRRGCLWKSFESENTMKARQINACRVLTIQKRP